VHHQLAALPVQRDLLVPDLPEEVHALARRLVQRRTQLVLRQPRLQRAPQRRLGPEEAIGRHQATNALVRPEEVVVREEVPHAHAGFRQILRPRPLPKLQPDRLPQPLALAQLCAAPDYVQ